MDQLPCSIIVIVVVVVVVVVVVAAALPFRLCSYNHLLNRVRAKCIQPSSTMGASDSKLVFKKGIFRLSEERHIPSDDPSWAAVSFALSQLQRPLVVAVAAVGCTVLTLDILTVLGASRVSRGHLQPFRPCRHPAHP